MRVPSPARRVLPAAAALAAVLAGAVALGGCGSGSGSAPAATAAAPAASTQAIGTAEPQTVPRDSEEAASFAQAPGAVQGPSAPAPGAVTPARSTAPSATGGSSDIAPGAPSDAEVRAELEQMTSIVKAQKKRASAAGHGVVLGPDGLAEVANNVPDIVARIVAGANAIARFPYVYGGGHASFVDNAYDCSASLSYALAAGGLLKEPLVSGDLATWGDPGPGRWITIYANEGHTFMYVAGLRYDTSGRDGPRGSRWQTAPRSLKGFAVRHPPGL